MPGKPVLLCGWMDEWPAKEKWTIENLRRNYRTAKFKVGEKDNGDKIRLKMVRPSNSGRSFGFGVRSLGCYFIAQDFGV